MQNPTLSNRVALGRKPNATLVERVAEARRLSDLLDTERPFAFIRLGDYDLALLAADEEASEALPFFADGVICGTQAKGGPGLKSADRGRLTQAIERASYIDYHELMWGDPSVLDFVKHLRQPGQLFNSTAETSYVLATWLEKEFKNYCNNRKVLFCGAEAGVLEHLAKSSRTFTQSEFWPQRSEIHTLVPIDHGKNLSSNIDRIKEQISREVRKNSIDTIFISLGGAAKILCVELAQELGICAVDFGVGLRALCYMGSTGHRPSRATHLVFCHRLPFNEVMDGIEHAFPDERPEELLARAHAQLLLEVQEKEVGWSHSAWENDFSHSNLKHFKASFREYKSRYRASFKENEATRKERSSFLHFCGVNKLTIEGRIFITRFRIMSAFSRGLRMLLRSR